LAKTASQITLLEIIETLNGPIELISCNTKDSCEFDSFCSLVGVWQDLKTKIESHFSALTLDRFLMTQMRKTSPV
jgi:Rrf2 family iron-sulfur cluster assembly transcriptional regulator